MIDALGVDGGAPLVLARALHVAGALSVLGTLTLTALIARPVLVSRPTASRAAWNRASLRLVWIALALAWAAGAVWLVIEANLIGGGPDAAWPVLARTRFGHLLATRLALLTLAAAARSRPGVGATVAAIAVATEAGHGHALAMAGSSAWARTAAVLHPLAAGIWIGGLAPLLILLGQLPPEPAAQAARRFTWLGAVCVVTLFAAGATQGLAVIGGPENLIASAYGETLLLKLALFTTLTGLALRNRFHLVPAMRAQASVTRLRHAVLVETALGLLAVLAAGLLTSLPPGNAMSGM